MIPISSMLGLMLVSKYKRNDDYNLLYSKSILTKCKVLGGRSLPIVEYINIDDSYPTFLLEFRKNLESGYLSLFTGLLSF